MRLLAILLTSLGLFASMQATAREVALVIANSLYDPHRDPVENPNLRNATNDAKLIAVSLEQAGFDEVVIASNLNTDEFHRNLDKFTNLANGADTAVIYFAGHGVQHKGTNWLIPTGVSLGDASELPDLAIQLEKLLDALAGAKLRIAAIDACRNSVVELGSGDESQLQGGLVASQVKNAMLIFAASPGEYALDSIDGSVNSPFALAFSTQLTNRTRLHELGGRISEDVTRATQEMQSPITMIGMSSKNAFLTTEQYQQALATIEEASPSDAMMSLVEEKEVWKVASEINTVESYQIYLDEYPGGRFRKFAELAMRKLA